MVTIALLDHCLMIVGVVGIRLERYLVPQRVLPIVLLMSLQRLNTLDICCAGPRPVRQGQRQVCDEGRVHLG